MKKKKRKKKVGQEKDNEHHVDFKGIATRKLLGEGNDMIIII
jgi:hypothetical protein